MQKPNNKVAAGGLAGALSMLLIWLLGSFEIEVPAEAASAITVVISFIVSYFVPESARPEGVVK